MRSHLLTTFVLAALSVGAFSGCLSPVSPPSPPSPAPTPRPDDVKPAPSTDHTDAEFWTALARRVAAGKIDSTDEILLILKAAKEAGDITNPTAIETAIPNAARENEPITETNRQRIADAISRLK